jgi:hypothetical protein
MRHAASENRVRAAVQPESRSIPLTRNRPSRLHREYEQAERDDGQRNHGNSDNLNPKGLGIGRYQPWDRRAAKSKPNDQASFQPKNGPVGLASGLLAEAKKPDLNIQAEPSACWLGLGHRRKPVRLLARRAGL